MKIYISLFLALSFFQNCKEPDSKPLAAIQIPVEEKPIIVEDSLYYRTTDIDPFWVHSDFDSVVAVILDGSHEIMYDVLKMDEAYAPSSKRKLSEEQFKMIVQHLSGKTPSKYSPADCFQPYHGFLFYKKGKIKARLAICFSCGTYFSQPKNSGGIDYQETEKIIQDLGLPTYNWDDSTEAQTSKIKYIDFFKFKKNRQQL